MSEFESLMQSLAHSPYSFFHIWLLLSQELRCLAVDKLKRPFQASVLPVKRQLCKMKTFFLVYNDSVSSFPQHSEHTLLRVFKIAEYTRMSRCLIGLNSDMVDNSTSETSWICNKYNEYATCLTKLQKQVDIGSSFTKKVICKK